jgi:hypothetical protein
VAGAEAEPEFANSDGVQYLNGNPPHHLSASVPVLSPAVLIVICFSGAFCVAPVSFYLCWLASVNRRDHPTVVNGVWDFVGLVAALAGFLIVGGLLLLTIVQNDPRLFTGGDFQALRATWEVQWLAWVTVFLGYLGLITLAVVWTVRGRSGWLSVYNVDLNSIATAIDDSLARTGVQATRSGNLWHRGEPLVEVIPFHGTSHATVCLRSNDHSLRAEIERHLRDHLSRAISPGNPASAWFSTLAGASVLAVVGFVALIAYTIFFLR